MIGRYTAREKKKRRIAISLFEIAEYLIVSAVLLDNVDHVLERRIFLLRLTGIPAVGPGDTIGESDELRGLCPHSRNDRQRAVDLSECVIRSMGRHLLVRLPVSDIGCSATFLHIYDDQIGTVCCVRCRIPATWNSVRQRIVASSCRNSGA